MDGINIGLFDRDWNNTLYFFMLNADEQIYMRYGGRDARSADVYLNLDSLELALKKGLELHQKHLAGEWKPPGPAPKPLYPHELPLLVENTTRKNRCVECHLIQDYSLLQQEEEGTLDKLTQMYRSPDIRTIGIELDVPRGLAVKEATGPVQAAGLRADDVITALNGTPVYTFGDLQYFLDRVPRTAKEVRLTAERAGEERQLTVALPERWWLTDLRFRQFSVEPRAEFESRPLTEMEKRELSLNPKGFAGAVRSIGGFAEMLKMHELKTGDIVTKVDGVDQDEIANTPELYIKLRKKAGDAVTLDVIRDGKPLQLKVSTQRMYFRK